MATGISHISL